MTELRKFSFIKLVLTGLFLAAVSACGGGGSGPGFIGGGPNDPGGGGGGTLTIALTDTSGNPTSTISDASPGVITVSFTGGAGALVNVTTTAGAISPSSGLTNEDGVASFVLEANQGSGAGQVTATVDDVSAFLNFEIQSVNQGNNVLVLALTDSSGDPTENITDISPATLTVNATDAFGQPVANQIVTASATIGVIAPASGTALTDLNGVATFTLGSDGTLGAGTVTATLGGVSSSLNYQIGEANLRIGRFEGGNFIEGEIQAGATSLPAAGSTSLSVTVTEGDGTPVSSVVPVQFTSGCASLEPPLAELNSTVNTINGVATATFTADGCTGSDTVTAAIVQGNTQTATVTLSIATADVNSIAFLDAVPQTIALQGTGGAGRLETAEVSFQVLDTTGAPAAGIDVDFSLSTTIGGLGLTNPSATTNEQGIARAIVQSGNVSTSVRVTATLLVGGTTLSTVSDRLIVSTGLPDQNSVSMGPETGNPGGLDVDGVTTEVTVRMADKFNNPVPNGTVAFFTTEYGSIQDSCELAGGACSVTWTSQAPRFPLLANDTGDDGAISTIFNRDCPDYAGAPARGRPCPSYLGPISAARSAITVIAVGEEAFIDTNGNGLYDVGEQFEDLPEAFLDKNDNGIFDNRPPFCTPDTTTDPGRECAEGLEEIFFDFNENGVYDEANGIYNGSLCPLELEATGQCTRELLHVRDTAIIAMSSNDAFGANIALYERPAGGGLLQIVDTIFMEGGGEDRQYLVAVSDDFNHPPPAQSTVAISAEGCELISNDVTVPNTTNPAAFLVGFTVVNQSDNTANLDGSVTITLTAGGVTKPLSIPCTDEAG
ncbi:MAG: hypothetical protein V2I66_14800 [Halieaceae bacterium]|nr:hypothetical protein [Halieaceae bacterium]